MPNTIQTFGFSTGEVRTILIDSQPWFVAVDICSALSLTNPTKALASLDSDERANFKLGRQGEANIINESGLYALIFKSRKPIAKQFRKWVTNEVLPTIRKTGSYTQPQPTIPQQPQTLTPAQQRHIQERINYIVRHTKPSCNHAKLYGYLKTHFQVGTYKDIPAHRYPEVCQLLKCEPRVQKTVAAPTDRITVKRGDLMQMLFLLNTARKKSEIFQDLAIVARGTIKAIERDTGQWLNEQEGTHEIA